MKVNYIKSWDSKGYTIKQNIIVNQEEAEPLKKFFTEYTIKQGSQNIYSLGSKALFAIRDYLNSCKIDTKRILNRNTFLIIK